MFKHKLIIEEEKIYQQQCGSFSGIKLLAGRGPGIKIRISTVGNIKTDLKSEFTSKGINQTLHKTYLDMKCTINAMTPFKDIQDNITNKVLLSENIIVGQLPSTYYNLEGINSSDVMEVMEQS